VTPDILNFAKQVTNGAQPLGGVVASKEIYDTFMAAGGPEYMLEFPTATPTRPTPWPARPASRRSTSCRRKTCRPREGAGAAFRACRAQPEGRQACGRHPQLRPGRRLHHRALPGEPARRPYEIAMKCWKKGFYVRYGGDTIQLAPPFISDPGRDRPPGQRAGRRPARNRLNSCFDSCLRLINKR
jgi:beta-alanine--pyruvate transaminase